MADKEKDKKFKEFLLRSLTDEEVLQAMRRALHLDEASAPNLKAEAQPVQSEELQQMRDECEKYRTALEEAQQRVKLLEQESAAWQERCRKAAEAKDDADMQLKGLMIQVQSLQHQIEDLQFSASQKSRQIEQLNDTAAQQSAELSHTQSELQKAAADNEQLQSKNSRLNTELKKNSQALDSVQKQNEKLQTELSRRLSAAYGAYEKYHKLSDYSKKLLSGVFRRDDFEGFVAGGVQEKSLAEIWKAAKEQIDKPDQSLIWEIFCTFLALYNKSQKQDRYTIENVQPGSQYDEKRQMIYKDSKAQGTIKQVKLLGYMNTYSNKIEHKSIVFID